MPQTGIRYFDDFQVGEGFSLGPVVVEDKLIGDFAILTGDLNPHHLNPEFASTTLLGGVTAHGLLVVSLFSGLLYKSGILTDGKTSSLEAFTSFTVSFDRPVKPGQQVRFQVTVENKEDVPRMAAVLGKVTISLRGEVLIAEGKWKKAITGRIEVIMRKRSAES